MKKFRATCYFSLVALLMASAAHAQENEAESPPAADAEAPDESAADGPPAVRLEGVSFAYDPARPVLRGLDVLIPAGQFVALTGDNGAGKTTFARHLIGLLRPAQGSVEIFGGKRQMLRGRRTLPAQPDTTPNRHALILGAGIYTILRTARAARGGRKRERRMAAWRI